MDGYPEIVLRDEAYSQNRASAIIAAIQIPLQEQIPNWLDVYSDIKLFFEESKKNINFLKQLVTEYSLEGSEVYLNVKPVSGSFYFEKTTNIKKESFFNGKGHFYEMIYKTGYIGNNKVSLLNKNILQSMIECLGENNFFQFSLIAGGIYRMANDDYLVPPLGRFARGQAPTFFDGTIFKFGGLDYFNLPEHGGIKLIGAFLTLTLMKEKPNLMGWGKGWSIKDYIETMKKMSPRAIRGLFGQTQRELINALQLIVKRAFRTKVPCVVDIRKGIFLVSERNEDKATIKRLANLGVTVFPHISVNKIPFSFFMDKVLPLNNLPNAWELFEQNSYFYLKNGQMIVHERKSGKEFTIY